MTTSSRPMRTAFILGAGLGIRLRPLTDKCPKPLLEIGGHPIITYAMDHLLSAGIERFVINTHHLAEAYHQAFPGGHWRGIPILFRHEPVLLDTAGGLKNIEDLLEPLEPLLVYNGDIITNLPLQDLLAAHAERGKEVTLALRSTGPLLNVNLNERAEVCDLRHTLGISGVRSCLFTGIYVVEKRFLGRLEAGRIESVILPFIRLLQEKPGAIAGAVINEGFWHDIGSVKEYERVHRLMSPVRTGRGGS